MCMHMATETLGGMVSAVGSKPSSCGSMAAEKWQDKICYSHGDVTSMWPCVKGIYTISSDL